MAKRFSDEQLNDLKSWLHQYGVTYKNLHRDFSDALPLANLLKKMYPKLIDLHNYSSANSTQLKLNNWETLNFKALGKLGLSQNKNMLNKLAKGTPGFIESLLRELMVLERLEKQSKVGDQNEQEQKWSENQQITTIMFNKRIDDNLVPVPQKMILYSIYEQAVKESQAKDNLIRSAQQKITHLENVIQLKTERIDELCTQMAKLSVRSLERQRTTMLEHSLRGGVLVLDELDIKSPKNVYRSTKNVTA
ncbi:sperm flagellar protein 1 [Stomoxys calcitrans]|uniref:sperm flagellar protein 1 n=1 Tax=Stomoxys calcitrans TaxID=35570 RepID=UPI0027E35B1F|nr:sperm flagellar protein 1 [Stomoxys calcitrans]